MFLQLMGARQSAVIGVSCGGVSLAPAPAKDAVAVTSSACTYHDSGRTTSVVRTEYGGSKALGAYEGTFLVTVLTHVCA
jgi:hypothetical protein